MTLIFEESRAHLLGPLYELFRFEASIVAGPHGGQPPFKPWSVEEVVEKADGITEEVLLELIDVLEEKGQLMVIPATEEHPTRYVTRTSEMVRTIGTMHEYVKRQTDEEDEEDADEDPVHLQLIEAVKWIPAVMDRPQRNVSLSQFMADLQARMNLEDPQAFPPDVDKDLAQLAVVAVLNSIATEVAGGPEKFYLTRFQARAIMDALLTSWCGRNQPLVVSAGTGSGKTIAFTVPVLVDSLLRNHARKQAGQPSQWTQLLTYPRNDLAFDQYSTLTNYIERLNKSIENDPEHVFRDCQLTIAVDAGGMIKRFNKTVPGTKLPWDPKKEWMGPGKDNVVCASVSRYGGIDPVSRHTPLRAANIVIAGLESFRRRMVIPEVVQACQTSLQRIVFDEIHLASGLEGGHIRGLFNRLHSIVHPTGRKLDFIAASATIAEAPNHVAKVWGSHADEVVSIEPTEEESKGTVGGIVNHVLVRPRTGVTKGGPVYNTTSLIGHQTMNLQQLPDPLSSDEVDATELEKMICFADSKEFVGRWQMILNENEGTMNAQSISQQQIDDGKGGAITLPYGHWFDRPMAQILNDTEMCKKCKGGTTEDGVAIPPCKLEQPVAVPRENLFSFRTKIGGLSEAEPFAMECLSKEGDDIVEVNGLDECPMLQAGVCWWFANNLSTEPITANHITNGLSDEMKKRIAKRPNMGDEEAYVFKGTLRSRRHTADQSGKKGKDGLSDDPSQFSSDKLFYHRSGEAYPPIPDADKLTKGVIPHNVIVATPTLEVGVDMNNVANVVMHRAMRDIASYRQKAGRAGREKNSVVNVTTVLSKRSQDYEFYNHHGKLILQPIRKVVPVASMNRSVMLSQAYMCVMDFIASHGINIEEIARPEWPTDLQSAIDLLEDSATRNDCIKWIKGGFWGTETSASLPSEELNKIISTFLKHLKMLNETTFTSKNQKEVGLTDAIQIMHGGTGSKFPHVDEGAKDKILKFVEELRTKLDLALDLLNEDLVDDLNRFLEATPYNIEELSSLYERLVELQSQSKWADKAKIGPLVDLLGQLAALLEEDDGSAESEGTAIAKAMQKAFRDLTAQYYLSFLLATAECFLTDAPYCFVNSILENPKEVKINIERQEGTNIPQTLNQVMRDLLPGTWNFRLAQSGTGHALKSPIGGDGIQREGPYDMVELNAGEIDTSAGFPLNIHPPRIRQLETRTASIVDVPWNIRMGFSETDSPKIVRPTFLRLSKEWGMSSEGGKRNVPSKVGFVEGTGLVSGMDVTDSAADYSLIPESWPMRWSNYAMEQAEQIRSYSPSTLQGKEGTGRRDVTRHPMFHRAFESIQFSDALDINDIVTGVQRTRGISLRYEAKFNGETQDVVFGDAFTTDGIVYCLSSSIVERIKEDASALSASPFDADFIKLLHHHIEKLEIFEPREKLTIRSIVQILLIKLHEANSETMPSTVGEAISLLKESNILSSEQELYLGTVRKNIRELFKENLETCVPKYNEHREKVWDEENLKASAEEWRSMTLLNTLGRGLVQTVSTYSGVQEEKISASININDHTVAVYDNEPGGNGTSASVKQHYQITRTALAAQRQMFAPPVPTGDYISIFENWLSCCNEHLNHRVALVKHVDPEINLHKSLRKHERASQHLTARFSAIWEALHVTTLRRAGLLSSITPYLVGKLRDAGVLISSVDLVDQAMSLCDTGCFACHGSYAGSSFPGILSDRYTSRNIVEQYFGLSHYKSGYATQVEARRQEGVKLGGTPEEFPHWKRSEEQIITFPQTCVPQSVAIHATRSSGPDIPEPKMLMRLYDTMPEEGDGE
jgi:hypothetical protein